MSDVTDQLEQQRVQRAHDMAKVQGRDPVGVQAPAYGLCTYTASGEAHLYTTRADGSSLDQATAEAAGGRMKSDFASDQAESFDELTVLVLPLEALPS